MFRVWERSAASARPQKRHTVAATRPRTILALKLNIPYGEDWDLTRRPRMSELQPPAHAESACTCTEAESLSPCVVARPHLRPLGSAVTAVHSILPRPVSSAARDTGIRVKPLMRSWDNTTLLGCVLVSYTVTTTSSVPSLVMTTSTPLSPPTGAPLTRSNGTQLSSNPLWAIRMAFSFRNRPAIPEDSMQIVSRLVRPA